MALNSWREIAQTLWRKVSVKAKRKLRGRSGDAGGSEYIPPIISMLDCLSGFIKHRATESNFPGECEGCSEPVCSAGNLPPPGPSEPSPPAASPETVPSSSSSGPSSPPPSSSVTPTNSRKRKAHPTALKEGMLDSLKKLDRDGEEENEEAPFGQMVTGMLMTLPPQKRKDAKLEIQQMLHRMQKEFCQEEANQ